MKALKVVFHDLMKFKEPAYRATLSLSAIEQARSFHAQIVKEERTGRVTHLAAP
jgi:hypothetical protein